MTTIPERAIAIASRLAGTKEITPNRSPRIDYLHWYTKLPAGNPYCVTFLQYCYKKACEEAGLLSPLPLTASSQTLWTEAEKLRCTDTDFRALLPGDIVIWRKYRLWQGHAGLAVSVYNSYENSFRTIEANTQPDQTGNQREGDGIYDKKRFARKIDFTVDAFYLRGFIRMTDLLEKAGYAKPLIY